MQWIRIAVGIMRDPTICALAEAVGVSVPATTGHVVGVLTSLPEGSKTGDLSRVSDATIEQWAMWRGKRGAFAAAFRAQLCDAQGVVRSWEKHNGAAIRRAEEAAARAKHWRDERKTNATANAHRTHTKRVANAHRESLRNETRRNNTTSNGVSDSTELSGDGTALARSKGAPRPASPARFPAFAKADREAAYASWTTKLGAVDFGRLVNAVGPLFRPADDPAHIPHAALLRGIRDYAGVIAQGRSAPFASPEDCAKRLAALANAALANPHDPIARADAVTQIIHGAPLRGAA